MSFPPETPNDARRHELLADCAEQTAKRLIEKHALDEDVACDIGNDLADFLADHWKGQTFYLPGDQAYRLNQRDWDIFRRMERGNANDLAMELGISKVRVHQVFKRCLAEYRARTQNSLFSEVPAAPTMAGREASK
jgi:Mor family transcriptional regulator